MPQHKRYFRNLLINKKFQLRFSFYVCTWILALSLVFPLIIYGLFDTFMMYAAMDPMGPTAESIRQMRSEVIWMLIIMEIVFIGITFIISIFISHRIAGPLHKLQKSMEEAAAGRLEQKISFRKHDYFPELASSFNRLLASCKKS